MMRAFLILLVSLAAAIPVFASAEKEAHVIPIELNKGTMVHLPRTALSVMIANPVVADIQVITPHLVYVYAKKIGETSLYAIDIHDNTILDATVQVTHNISEMEKTVHELVPDADVNFKTVDGGLVMNGYVDSPIESDTVKNIATTFMGKDDKLIDLVTTAGSDQVMLMVKVAEVDRSELKEFGINIEAALSQGSFAFNLLQGRIFTDSTSGQLIQNSTTAGSENFLNGSFSNGKVSTNSLIDALETQGLVSILAEPNLTTTSGKTANFLAGGEFPIPIIDSQGQVNVEYKPFGVSLNFTPVVLTKDKISLTVAPEVSNITQVNSLTLGGGNSSSSSSGGSSGSSTSTFSVPSIATRRAQTTVELGSGQTFAIAGLLSNDRTNDINKFPGLGDLPVLGALFRSHNFQNDQSELVILVTPIIVHGASQRAQMQSPLDGYTPPSDLQRIMSGELYQQSGPKADAAKEAAKPEVSEAPAPEVKAMPPETPAPPVPALMPEMPATLPPSLSPNVPNTPGNTPALHGSGGFMLE